MRTGALFAGYGGLEMAANAYYGAQTAWVSDIDPGACRILAHHWPDVPNLGDITKIDWSAAEPVDILTGGWPCQPFSLAGKRKGASDERALWPYVAGAVRALRPRHVVLENVAAIATAGELARACADLAALGYVGSWRCLRAADVGAPHGRARIFIVATDTRRLPGSPGRLAGSREADSGRPRRIAAGRNGTSAFANAEGFNASRSIGVGDRSGRPLREDRDGGRSAASGVTTADPTSNGRNEGWPEPARIVGGSDAATDAGSERHGRGQDGGMVGRLDGSQQGETRQRERSRQKPRDRGAAVAANTESAAQRGTQPEHLGATAGPTAEPRECASPVAWGEYEPAIRRWERVLGRQAPAPTEASMRGTQRLSPRFVEWMMGLPEGWVTHTPGLTRNAQLKALGNGVVPQQAFAALQAMAGQEMAA